MKKNSEKKLTLGKIKIASLSKNNQQTLNGGMINLSRTGCDEGAPCVRYNTYGCTTGYLYCSC